jgi:hypothetical protein
VGIFSSIRNAIFGRRQAAPAPARPGAPAADAAAAAGAAGAMFQAEQARQQQAAAQAQAQAQAPQPPAEPVDVEEVLQEIAQEKGNPNLNWRRSIVDLMKLLDLDSSLDNRRELATELGYTGEKNGSAEMNIWLHRRVMEELERNGGRVPATMKD